MKWQTIKKEINDVTKYGNALRGEIINDVVILETTIDVYLSVYFSNVPDRQDELGNLLFSSSSPSMAFDVKRNLLANIFQKNSKNFYVENKFFFEDLSFVIKHRNVLAHYLLDTSEEWRKLYFEKKTIGFLKFKSVSETVPYTQDLIKEIRIKIKSCISMANDLTDCIMNKKTMHPS